MRNSLRGQLRLNVTLRHLGSGLNEDGYERDDYRLEYFGGKKHFRSELARLMDNELFFVAGGVEREERISSSKYLIDHKDDIKYLGEGDYLLSHVRRAWSDLLLLEKIK